MDFEVLFGNRESLLYEFFPGKLRPAEETQWNRDRAEYNDARKKATGERTPPATPHPAKKSKAHETKATSTQVS